MLSSQFTDELHLVAHPVGVAEGEFILIVEQDKHLGLVLAEIIQEYSPYQLILASDLEQAFDIVRRSKPYLFLLDSYLGWYYHSYNVNGIHLYDALHALKGREDVPAIVMIDDLSECAALRDRGVTWFNTRTSNLIDTLPKTIEEVLIQAYGPRREARAA